LATAEDLNINKIITHDEAFKRMEWLKMIDSVSKRWTLIILGFIN